MLELTTCHNLDYHVNWILIGMYFRRRNMILLHDIPYKMIPYIDVLGPNVMNMIFSQVNRNLTITP